MKKYLHFIAVICAVFASLRSVAQTTPDPGLPGPLAVTKAEYNLGDAAVTLDSLPVPSEVRGSVHYPTGLPGGPYPVIFLLHGRHSTCYNTSTLSTSSVWPCPTGRQPIVSYQGYDYFARNMASHGYIVISISCNAINATDGSMADNGMPARGQLVQHHMNLWNTWNTSATGPFAGTFVGKLNMQNIGTMGHSRGGEGVIFNARLNKSLGSPYGIKAIITLAPVDFKRRILNGIPIMNIAPYCDGDVSNLQGVRFYDDTRYTDTTDETPRYSVLMMGANHNFYNTVWTPGSYIAGGADDWLYAGSNTAAHCGMGSSTSKRLDTTKQKAAYNAYASAFFRIFLGKETKFEPILEVKDLIPPASSLLDTTNVFVSYHPGRTDRRDINRQDTSTNLTVNTMGASVTQTGLVAPGLCGGGYTMPLCGIASTTTQEPHRRGTTGVGLGQMSLVWNDTTDWYQNDILPANQDLRFVHSLQFRAALKYNQCTTGLKHNFTVQLIDSAGAVSSQRVSDHSRVLFYPPGTASGTLPKVMFNTVRIPISSFTGIDRKKVRKVKFLFNKMDSGAVLISDLAFVNEKCGMFDAAIGYTSGTGFTVNFKDTLVKNTQDTLTWLWKFGDPASGVNDTSTLHNPTHIFSGAGTYTACLYVRSKRVNGTICTDTLCRTITLSPAGIADLSDEGVNIYPNPATNVLHVTGVAANATLRLENTIGQTVLTEQLTGGQVVLPSSLANGMYYAVISSNGNTIYRKVLISR